MDQTSQTVICVECDRVFQIDREASSIVCPRCGTESLAEELFPVEGAPRILQTLPRAQDGSGRRAGEREAG